MNFNEANNETADVNVETEPSSRSTDRFTQLMFGNRIPKKYSEQYQIPEDEGEQQKDEVNYFMLIEQIDDIMVSLDNLKPILKEFAPILDYIKKKI